jgi:hypothetical protein
MIAESKKMDGRGLVSIRQLTHSKPALHLDAQKQIAHTISSPTTTANKHNSRHMRCISQRMRSVFSPADRSYKAMQFEAALNDQKRTLPNTSPLTHGHCY